MVPSSSPFPARDTLTTQEDDDGMELDGTTTQIHGKHIDYEVQSRYEETNRLLRELEVVRRSRWGEGG